MFSSSTEMGEVASPESSHSLVGPFCMIGPIQGRNQYFLMTSGDLDQQESMLYSL